MKKNPSVVTIILFLFIALITTVLFSCNNEITTYTVHFNSQEGTPIDLVRVSKGSRIAEPPEPTRENYDFDGWYTDPSFAMAWKFNQDKVTYDLTLYAKWVERRYSINFNGNGHTDGEVPSIQEEQQGQTITLPGSEILHRTGYEFVCWNTQADGFGTDYAADYEFVVDANITFYAKWSARQYTVTFDKKGGNNGPDSITVTYDSAMPSATAPTKTGAAFDGYFDQVEGGGSQYYSSTMDSLKSWDKASDSTLFANWVITYTVTFDSQGGSSIADLENVRKGSRLEEPLVPTRDCHVFGGWYKDSSFDELWVFDSDTIEADTILYAKWIPLYIITFDTQGGSTPVPASKEVTFGNEYGVLPNLTRTGFIFDGWWTEPDGLGTHISESIIVSIKVDQILYAKWIPQYTITFDGQGGSIPSPASKEVIFGEEYGPLPIITRTNYDFDGWWTEPAGGGTRISESSIVSITANQVLYVKWIPQYTVTFDRQGGRTPNPSSKMVGYGQEYGNLPTITRNGYDFDGWWTGINGTGDQITATSEVAIPTNHSLYAKWLPKSYTITFDSQGGTVSISSKVVIFGQEIGTLPTPTKPGYTFMGWWTGSSGSGSQIEETTILTLPYDITYYAWWVFTPFIGPGGGYVFYENANFAEDGWRYLEAAPEDWSGLPPGSYGQLDPGYPFGYYRPNGSDQNVGTEKEIGTGKGNTATLIRAMGNSAYTSSTSNETTSNYAAKVCAEYRGKGFDDWFLPSQYELHYMILSLRTHNVGELYGARYWSSSEYSTYPQYAKNIRYDSGYIISSYGYKDIAYSVRPIRAY